MPSPVPGCQGFAPVGTGVTTSSIDCLITSTDLAASLRVTFGAMVITFLQLLPAFHILHATQLAWVWSSRLDGCLAAWRLLRCAVILCHTARMGLVKPLGRLLGDCCSALPLPAI